MAYTFGAGTGDDITISQGHNLSTSGSTGFICGWWYPTTLTATRGYCSFANNICGLEVDSTTANFRFRSDNTTDGQWTAPGAVTVDKWWFIAFAFSFNNTGPAAGWRCWVGDATDLNEITVTQAVAPVGNFANGGADRVVGNKGTGTLAFQGDVGWMTVVGSSATGINSPLGIGTAGAIAAAEADLILKRWVIPLWQGRPDIDFQSFQTATDGYSIIHIPLNMGNVAWVRLGTGIFESSQALTINGATISARTPPRSPPECWPIQLPRVIRAA